MSTRAEELAGESSAAHRLRCLLQEERLKLQYTFCRFVARTTATCLPDPLHGASAGAVHFPGRRVRCGGRRPAGGLAVA